MALAGRPVVDDSVIERRLRPIYEWLDTGNNKKAAQEADKVLKKQPRLQCARVLKGLAQLRMGKKDDCQALIDVVVKENPTDESTLQALTICFRELHIPDQICQVYETAVKSDPSNEELLSHLFMSYVRVSDYKKQQQVAMQLYKIKPKNPYYFWAVMSLVMQAHTTDGEMGRKVSLPLAERMVDRFVKEGKIESEAEVLIYLHILESQGKYQEALEVLDCPLSEKITNQPSHFLPLKRAAYLHQLKRLQEASHVYVCLATKEPDHWQHYVEFVGLQLEIATETESEEPLQVASSFLKECVGNATEKSPRTGHRAPQLGLLQLALVLSNAEKKEQIKLLCGDTTELVYIYIAKFGDRMCCYSDLINMLPLVQSESVDSLLTRVQDLVEMGDNGLPTNVAAVNRYLCWLQLSRHWGRHQFLLTQEHIDFADGMIVMYHRTFPLFAEMVAADERTVRSSDTLLVMAVQSYLASVHCADFNQPMCLMLLKAAAILEFGIQNSLANFQFRLLLIQIFNCIGSVYASLPAYEKLELKHIQLDTMGQVMAFQAVDGFAYGAADDIFSASLKFFMSNCKETSEPLISLYKYGLLMRIPEFVDMRERLHHSLQFAQVTAEQMIMHITTSEVTAVVEMIEIVREMSIEPFGDRINWTKLRDNRDWAIMDCWRDISKNEMEKEIMEKKKEEEAMLRLRNTSLCLMGAAVRLAIVDDSVDVCDKENSLTKVLSNGDSMKRDDCGVGKLCLELEEDFRKIGDMFSLPMIEESNELMPRVVVYISEGYIPLILEHTKILTAVHKLTSSVDVCVSLSLAELHVARQLMESVLARHLRYLSNLQTSASHIIPATNAHLLAYLSHFVQTLAVISILLSCCAVLLRPLRSLSKRNRKKHFKQGETLQVCTVLSEWNEYVDSITTLLTSFAAAVNDKLNHARYEAKSFQICHLIENKQID